MRIRQRSLATLVAGLLLLTCVVISIDWVLLHQEQGALPRQKYLLRQETIQDDEAGPRPGPQTDVFPTDRSIAQRDNPVKSLSSLVEGHTDSTQQQPVSGLSGDQKHSSTAASLLGLPTSSSMLEVPKDLGKHQTHGEANRENEPESNRESKYLGVQKTPELETESSGNRPRKRTNRKDTFVRVSRDGHQVGLAMSMLPSAPGDITDNMAFQTLSSWPALPMHRKFVEKSLLLPVASPKRQHRILERSVFIFDYDVLEGARGLSFPSNVDESMQRQLEGELGVLWDDVLKPAKFQGLAPKNALASLNVEVLVGGGSQRWFILMSNQESNQNIIKKWASHHPTAELKTLGDVLLVTIAEGSLLIELIFNANNDPENSLEGVITLLRGHMQWGYGQLEQEVLFGYWWPCEKVEEYIVNGQTKASGLFNLFMQPAQVPMNGHYNLDMCRIGVREAIIEGVNNNNDINN